WKAITVRHLLTHTSGLPGDDGFKALRAAGQRVNYTTAQLFDAAVKDELKFAAGERFLYSDGGYFVLGMIIEAVSGQRYRDFPDDGVTVVVLTNLGRSSGDPAPRVNAWGLTYGVAGRYVTGLLVGPQKAEADADPARTVRLRETLERIAKNEPDPTVLPLAAS